jgi:twinkle protein
MLQTRGLEKVEVSQSKFVKHIPCTECGSSDGNSLYDDDHEYCHVCHAYKSGDGSVTKQQRKPMNKDLKFYDTASTSSIADRGLTSSTCLAYGVKQARDKHYYPYYDADGLMVAIKTRDVENKQFSIAGDFKDATLFGQQNFTKGGRYLTICEGELDALAAYQMQGSKYPCVSIRNGASAALKDCKAQYEWIDSFENIVICFDADEPGLKASQAVAELFGGKVKVMKHKKGFKDACDYLKTNSTKEFIDAFWQAEQYRPEGLINGKDLWEELKQPQRLPDAHYPFSSLDNMLCGLRGGELITITSATGQGKSTVLRQFVHHLLKTTNDNIGLAFLEEKPARTALGIMAFEAGKALHLPNTEYSDEEYQRAFDNTMGTGRCTIFAHFGSLDIDVVLAKLRWMAKAQDCKWIFLDHYQMVLSGIDTDERKGLDMLLTRLRTFVEETGVGLFGVSHTRRLEGNKGLENGVEISLSHLRGTQGISQLSDAVIGLERNQQSDCQIEKNTTRLRVLKSRYTGETGFAGSLYFDKTIYRLIETFEDNSL